MTGISQKYMTLMELNTLLLMNQYYYLDTLCRTWWQMFVTRFFGDDGTRWNINKSKCIIIWTVILVKTDRSIKK